MAWAAEEGGPGRRAPPVGQVLPWAAQDGSGTPPGLLRAVHSWGCCSTAASPPSPARGPRGPGHGGRRGSGGRRSQSLGWEGPRTVFCGEHVLVGHQLLHGAHDKVDVLGGRALHLLAPLIIPVVLSVGTEGGGDARGQESWLCTASGNQRAPSALHVASGFVLSKERVLFYALC